jgi:hypothetical protein
LSAATCAASGRRRRRADLVAQTLFCLLHCFNRRESLATIYTFSVPRTSNAPFPLSVRHLCNCPPSEAQEFWRTLEAFRRIMGGMDTCFQTLELNGRWLTTRKAKQCCPNHVQVNENAPATEPARVFVPSKSRALCPARCRGSKFLRTCGLRDGSGVGTQGD